MDLLSDLLQQAGMHQRLLDLRPFSPGEARQFPCDRSFGFHLVLKGETELRGTAPEVTIPLKAGDVAFMARGCRHAMVGRGSAEVLSAAYQIWHDPVHPIFGELPTWRVVRAEDHPRWDALKLIADLVRVEYRDAPLGSETAVKGLLEAAFVQVLRRIVEGEDSEPLSLGAAWRSASMRKVLEQLHSRPTYGWTLEELAKVAGMSRSAFAAKFKSAVGDSPLGYLRRLRIARSMAMLSADKAPLAKVASAVGYGDPFVFSKAFKKVTGRSPREFRRGASHLVERAKA